MVPLIVAWVACGWLESTGALVLEEPTVQRVDENGRPIESQRKIELPLYDPGRPHRAEYRISGVIRYGRLSHPSARIVADDCIVSISVAGKPVDLSGLGREHLCDWQNGISIRFDGLLVAGDNRVDVVFRNDGGDLAFRMVPDPSPFARKSRIAQLLLALALAVGLLLRSSLALARSELILAGIVLAWGAMLRLDFVMSLHPPELHAFSDAGGYLSNAREMAAGTYRSNQLFQGIGLPLVLSWTLRAAEGQYWLFHWLHWAAAVAAVILAWRATARLWGERLALWALILLSLHFPFISLAGFFMAETLFTFFIALLFYWMSRWIWPWKPAQGAALGAAFMLGHAIKGLNAFFVPLSFLWAAAWSWRKGNRTARKLARSLLPPLGGFVAGVLVVAATQAVLTRSLWGKVVLSAPTGGLNLVEGKCPAKINKDSEGYGWQSPLFNQLGENQEKVWPRPFSDQAYFWRAGLECIRQDPLVVISSLAYVHYLFADNQIWPSNVTYPRLTRQYGMFFTALLFPGILLALLLLALRPLERDRLPFLLVLSIVACAFILKAEMRYRVPFDVLLLPMAVYGWAWIFEKSGFKAKKRGPRALILFTAILGAFVTYSIYAT
jgi:hypothetical protein